MAALAEAGAEPRSLLVTFGANGAAWDGVTALAHLVDLAEVADTTGAGDAFCGALAAPAAGGIVNRPSTRRSPQVRRWSGIRRRARPRP